jgi:hypothetical protein
MATRATPEFHQGAAGYGRYFWHSWVDQSSENYAVEFVVPTLTHEDIRYYTLGKGGFFKRTGYALSRAVVTRSDSGTATFNIGEVVGAGAAAGISNLYYPASAPSRTRRKNGASMSVSMLAPSSSKSSGRISTTRSFITKTSSAPEGYPDSCWDVFHFRRLIQFPLRNIVADKWPVQSSACQFIQQIITLILQCIELRF